MTSTHGCVVIVTGVSSGIGAASAISLAEAASMSLSLTSTLQRQSRWLSRSISV